MRDTPRVDAISVMKMTSSFERSFLMLQLARSLERELTAAHKRIAELEQVSAAGVKDAERYKWMRDTFINDDKSWPDDVSNAKTGEKLDLAIDAAIAMAKGVQS